MNDCGLLTNPTSFRCSLLVVIVLLLLLLLFCQLVRHGLYNTIAIKCIRACCLLYRIRFVCVCTSAHGDYTIHRDYNNGNGPAIRIMMASHALGINADVARFFPSISPSHISVAAHHPQCNMEFDLPRSEMHNALRSNFQTK